MYSLPKEIALRLIADYTVIAELIKDMTITDVIKYLDKVSAERGLCSYMQNHELLDPNTIIRFSKEITKQLKSLFIYDTANYIFFSNSTRTIEQKDIVKCITYRIQWLKDNMNNFQ